MPRAAAPPREGPHSGPCLLPSPLLQQATLRYDRERWDLVGAARAALACGDLPLQRLGALPADHPARGTPPGPAFDAEVGSFARVARLGPHRHSQRPAPLKAVVRSPRGLVLFRAPSDYAAAFGVTCHAREHFLQLQGAAPRTTSSSRRALQVRPAFPDAARAPPSDLTMRFLDMLRARDSIRIQKAAGAPWPWSGDDVLNRHKFTNVKREHDRVTAWLRAHWTSAHSDADAATVLFNCGVFRTFGTVAFAEALGWTHSLKDWDAGSRPA